MRRIRNVLALLVLLLVGLAAYPIGLHYWGGYHLRAARRALERRDFRQAGDHLRKCLRVWPDDPTTRLLAARTARQQGDYAPALEHLRVCRRKGDLQDAVALEYQLVRIQQGDLSEADGLLARCADRLKEPETPLILEALIAGNLKVLSALTALNQVASESELAAPYLADGQRAVELWLQVRPGRADRVEGLVWRGQLEGVAKHPAKGIADFREALELDPDHFDARMHLAMSIVQKAPEEAVAHFRRLRRHYPENNLVRFSLASSLRGLGQLEEARQILDAMLASNPNDVSALVERGYIALDTQRVEDAERRLRRAVELAPSDARSHLALSCCLQVAGKETEAKHHQVRFEQLEAEEKRSKKEAVQLLEAAAKRNREGLAQSRKAAAGEQKPSPPASSPRMREQP